MATRRIRGVGCIYASELGVDGQPLGLEDVGEAPAFEIALGEEVLEDRNTCEIGNPVAVRELLRLTPTVNITLKDFTGKNLARMMFGTFATVAPSTLTDSVWTPPDGSAFVVGKEYRLPNGYVNTTALTIKDAAGTPATLSSAHYVLDPIFGTLKITNAASYVLSSLKLSGTVNQADDDGNAVERVGLATGSPKPIYVMLKGKFELEGKVYYGSLELYKVRLSPADSIPWKSADTFAEATMSGTALTNADIAPKDSVFGNIGRKTWIGYIA